MRHGTGRRTVAATVAVLLLAGLAGAGATVRAQTAPLRYVALGDSYTAGPYIPDQLPDPPGCRRSDRNYPHVAAAVLGAALRDVSCSSATTDHLFGPQPVQGGPNPPQLDAVTADTTLVTIGIGGNDIGFGEIVTSCISATPLGSPCRDRYVRPEGDLISARIAGAATRVAAVLAEVARRAPAARVLVVGYPAILPDAVPGCWPVMPFTFADGTYLRDKERELNAMLAVRAAAAGATYLDTYGPSRGHEACAFPTQRWVEPVVPLAPAAPVHPNGAGMQAVGHLAAAALGRG